jgi:hypothetical protein
MIYSKSTDYTDGAYATLLTNINKLCFLKTFSVVSGGFLQKNYFTFMTYHQIFSTKKMTDATSGAGTAHPSGAPKFIPFFSGVHVAQSLVFWVVFCRPLYVFLAIVLSVFLWISFSDCPLGIFKLMGKKVIW